MEENRLYTWIKENAPGTGEPAKFVSNARLYYGVLGYTDDITMDGVPGYVDTPMIGQFVYDELESVLESLFTENDLAVQLEAQEKGVDGGIVEGIRIMKVA